jgi:hypothetical protein
MSRAHLIALVFLLCGAGACPDENPDVVVPPNNPTHDQPLFADIVLGYTVGSATTSCIAAGVPQCGSTMPQASCQSDPVLNVLGENDGVSYEVKTNSRVELGFLCDSIIEVGVDTTTDMQGRSVDFVVWGMATTDSIPVVEVGDDGVNYVSVNFWPKNMDGTYVLNGGFELEVASRASARFVRISNTAAQGSIFVDAVEAVPRPE